MLCRAMRGMYTWYIHRILHACLGIARQGMRRYFRYAPECILFALLLMDAVGIGYTLPLHTPVKYLLILNTSLGRISY